jgi:hypothetical protein
MSLPNPSWASSARLIPLRSSMDCPQSGLDGGEETPPRLGPSQITNGMLWRGFKRWVSSQRPSRETLTLSEVPSRLTRRRNRARLLLFHDRFAVILKKTHFSPQISNKILKSQKIHIISYHSRRNLLQPQIVKNLLRKWSRFCKDIL